MTTLVIAFRNIFRNLRRSLTTVFAIAVGAVSILLFGGYVATIWYGMETGIVQRAGHLHVYRTGYFEFGAGNPAAWGIDRYEAVIAAIEGDPVLSRMVVVATPSLSLYGIAGNFQQNVSKTFLGTGLVPSDREAMRAWNDYGFRRAERPPPAMHDDDAEGGVLGFGLARILRYCEPLRLADCPTPPRSAETGAPVDRDVLEIAALDRPPGGPSAADRRPRVDLLAATAGGAPNVVRLAINQAERQGAKELDDAFVAMPLGLAQRLVYGREPPEVTAVLLQLRHTADMPAARARLAALFAGKGWALEVRDFTELTPMYLQVIAMFGAIFTFIAVLMGLIALFTVVNSMTMTVMERIAEIGTLRALGLRRGGVRRLFLTEGLLLGVIGATLGALLAVLASLAINAADLSWTPPGNTAAVPLYIRVLGSPGLLAGCWLALVLVTAVSALWPANRAARITVVDALRHA